MKDSYMDRQVERKEENFVIFCDIKHLSGIKLSPGKNIFLSCLLVFFHATDEIVCFLSSNAFYAFAVITAAEKPQHNQIRALEI